jgi:RNA polymerase sigma-70 factor (ECF subfamily)
VVLSDLDRHLIDRCLARHAKAWEELVDRYMGLVVHVINHTCQAKSMRLSPVDREDLCSEVFLAILRDDFAVLRHFRSQSSLATYLSVVARRVVVRSLLQRQATAQLGEAALKQTADHRGNHEGEPHINDRDEVERLLGQLDGQEAQIVRMYHLEGKSYHEISAAVGMPENSVGPTLSRAREKMRRAAAQRTS